MSSKSYRDLFKSTAEYYARYRHPYPQQFFDYLVQTLNLNGYGRLLDIGCGTGQLTIPLAPFFEKAFGLDPEPEMLIEARKLADKASVRNIEWIEAGSDDLEDLRAQLGLIKLVTMGNSFHWMDRDKTLEILDDMATNDGAVVIAYGADVQKGQNERWQEAVQKIIRKWVGEARRAGSSTYTHPNERFETVLARSPFNQVEVYRLEQDRQVSIEEIIGGLYSTSFASKAVLGEKQVPFERDLREALLQLNSTGMFTESFGLEALVARRN